IQLQISINTLQDLQQLLGEINWVRPVMGITNDELAPVFNLLRGHRDIKAPRTLTPEAQAVLERNHRNFPEKTSTSLF
ncbi:POK18 protein, partial [Catharus fuscescens]|nr:POK18 protein [Catharus fuscescens]